MERVCVCVCVCLFGTMERCLKWLDCDRVERALAEFFDWDEKACAPFMMIMVLSGLFG